MKKLKTLLTLSALAMCLAGMVFAFGSSAEGISKPEIISKNVKYTDKFILMYAVDAATVDGGEATLKVYEEYPTDKSTPICTLKDTTTETIKKADGTTYECYVFTTNGISATQFTTNYYVTVTDGKNVSDVARYSVAEYLNERLYKNGIAAVTEGDDAVRKDFYLSTLAFGANAEKVLYNLDDNAKNDREYLVTDYKYIYTDLGTIDGNFSAGVYAPETPLTFTAADSAKKYQSFEIDEKGAIDETAGKDIANGGTITADSNTIIMEKPSYKPGNGAFYSKRSQINKGSISVKNFDATTTPLGCTNTAALDSSVVEGVSVHKIIAAKETYLEISNRTAPTGLESYITVSEFDMKLSGFDDAKFVNGDYLWSQFPTIRVYTSGDTGAGSSDLFRFKANSDKETVSFYTANKVSIAQDEWFNVRIEVVYNSDNSASFDLYINNELVATHNYANFGTLCGRTRMKIGSAAHVTGNETVYIDNVFYGHIDASHKTVNK